MGNDASKNEDHWSLTLTNKGTFIAVLDEFAKDLKALDTELKANSAEKILKLKSDVAVHKIELMQTKLAELETRKQALHTKLEVAKSFEEKEKKSYGLTPTENHNKYLKLYGFRFIDFLGNILPLVPQEEHKEQIDLCTSKKKGEDVYFPLSAAMTAATTIFTKRIFEKRQILTNIEETFHGAGKGVGVKGTADLGSPTSPLKPARKVAAKSPGSEEKEKGSVSEVDDSTANSLGGVSQASQSEAHSRSATDKPLRRGLFGGGFGSVSESGSVSQSMGAGDSDDEEEEAETKEKDADTAAATTAQAKR